MPDGVGSADLNQVACLACGLVKAVSGLAERLMQLQSGPLPVRQVRRAWRAVRGDSPETASRPGDETAEIEDGVRRWGSRGAGLLSGRNVLGRGVQQVPEGDGR